MQLIDQHTHPDLASLLDAFEHPAILVDSAYRILATNDHYRDNFGSIDTNEPALCYQVSHGYDRPCDRAGELCPLRAATQSRQKERVLHIHQTPRGREHVDVELLPIPGADGAIRYFIELLKPLPIASAQTDSARLVGDSPAFNAMLEKVARVGPTDAAVLLTGESGTGKEMVASAIHEYSTRVGQPLVTLECAGLTETLFESELFGHAKGAFTGANYTREGLAASADGGTLFLDEIGDIPFALQVKLLRLLETGTFRPVGSTQSMHTGFRLICATHKDLWRMVEDGQFRLDLFYRINVFPLTVPALAERVADIPLIVRSLLDKSSPDTRYHLTEPAMDLLKRHHYRGNIRELRNILTRAVVLSNGNVIDHATIAECLDGHPAEVNPPSKPQDLRSVEFEHLQKLLDLYRGDKGKVAAAAGISLRTLYRKLERHPTGRITGRH